MALVGIVRRISGDKATISINRVSACGGNCSSCGGACESKMHDVEVKNSIHAKVGDIVHVEFSEVESLKASLIIYLIPLAGFLVGILLGYFRKAGDGLSLLYGVLGLTGSLLIIYFVEKNYKKKKLEIKISEFKK